EAWQRELRKQFGREQRFTLKNLGDQPFFSEFHVANPESKTTYRIAIRGLQPGENFCSCPDFATNTLGTCKHIEFTLARLEKRRGGRTAMAVGYRPPHSEIRLQYGDERRARFFKGEDCPAALAKLALGYFDSAGE